MLATQRPRRLTQAQLARVSIAEQATYHAAQALESLKALNALMRDEASLAARDELQALGSTIEWWVNFAGLHDNQD
ncbi:MAG: hypothetical protein IPM16_06620 [Chloroflexi bacterium]|nr:hypothetical protein [Chloroflexota bacterium]